MVLALRELFGVANMLFDFIEENDVNLDDVSVLLERKNNDNISVHVAFRE